jgi:hypothetical protein
MCLLFTAEVVRLDWKGNKMIAEIFIAKAIVVVAEKAIAPIADRHKSIEVTHKVLQGLNSVEIADIKKLIPLMRRKKKQIQ